ncbi:hypothetical protein PVK06_044872 [Gossypium arboreum]|uniref:Uncharacterized protein n=1 Tax=Gossypium arboreum TaxID=29729 RepID=A0ABR0MSE6_GOSAR|nr:hypothetical protein PVK06_044872 [Gossypium arboreum]
MAIIIMGRSLSPSSWLIHPIGMRPHTFVFMGITRMKPCTLANSLREQNFTSWLSVVLSRELGPHTLIFDVIASAVPFGWMNILSITSANIFIHWFPCLSSIEVLMLRRSQLSLSLLL